MKFKLNSKQGTIILDRRCEVLNTFSVAAPRIFFFFLGGHEEIKQNLIKR